ncbi:MAG TPA: NAD(+) synthetase, partial [Firmicutes bacterium]|nr:NAD(+) synthetase [Bacillota bacterium]
MRNWKTETENRVKWIQAALAAAGANGVVFGNSGGKDSALVGILCKKACDNTVGLIMPCQSGRNYTVDK